MICNKEHRLPVPRLLADHGRTKIMIVGTLIGKAPPVRTHGNDAWLASIKDVRDLRLMAFAKRHARHRHPGPDVRIRHFGRTTNGLGQPKTVSTIALGRHGHMFGRRWRVRERCRTARHVIRKAACCEYDAAPRTHEDRLASALDPSTWHCPLFQCQFGDGRIQPDRDAEIDSGSIKARRECRAVEEFHAAPVRQQIARILDQALGRVPGRRQ